MITKPSIQWLNTDSNPLLINDSSVVLNSMTNNVAIYDAPTPTLAEIQTALDNFTNAVADAAIGGPAATVKMNNLRLILTNLLRQLASYVAVACKGSMENLILSGFPVQKPVRQTIGPLPAPQGLAASHGAVLGQLTGKANPVFGASAYNWRLTPNTTGGIPVLSQTTAANQTFSNLTSGTAYAIECNAVGAAGTSDWSNPATMFAD
jgi:hypothetical protein